MKSEAGSVTIALLGVMAVAILVGLTLIDIAAYISGGVQASTAADAAALAAAPLTFRAFGSSVTPAREAAYFAAANGAVVVVCRCIVDRSWRTRTVEVIVERRLVLTLFGRRTIRAVGRAEFTPALIH